MDAEEAGDHYDRAVDIVLRDRKCSTSYIQRRLSVGYNKAASLVERMEKEGVVGAGQSRRQARNPGRRRHRANRRAFDIEAAESGARISPNSGVSPLSLLADPSVRRATFYVALRHSARLRRETHT